MSLSVSRDGLGISIPFLCCIVSNEKRLSKALFSWKKVLMSSKPGQPASGEIYSILKIEKPIITTMRLKSDPDGFYAQNPGTNKPIVSSIDYAIFFFFNFTEASNLRFN